ncbi:MAG: hypothetical protein J2P21_22180 [Chloracidobacterium sp.]|nr:hypothetical protein [Chloracidobacterium sp.]
MAAFLAAAERAAAERFIDVDRAAERLAEVDLDAVERFVEADRLAVERFVEVDRLGAARLTEVGRLAAERFADALRLLFLVVFLFAVALFTGLAFPLFLLSPEIKLTVAQARRSASRSLIPRSLYPFSIWSAKRSCFRVYLVFSPLGMFRLL